MELYKVIKKILKNNYQLNLPAKVRIYPIFYILLLENAININFINIKQDNVKIKKKKYKVKRFLIYVITKEKSSI